MVGSETISEISKMSIRFSAAFAIISVGLMYVYIGVTDASTPTKVLWASALSMAVAIVFMITWTIARDAVRQRERELKRTQMP